LYYKTRPQQLKEEQTKLNLLINKRTKEKRGSVLWAKTQNALEYYQFASADKFAPICDTTMFLFSSMMFTDSIFLGGKNVRDRHLCAKVHRFVEAPL